MATSWTPHSYPVQSPHPEPAAQHAATPTAQQPSTLRLPRTIRAAKDTSTFKPKGRTLIICLDGTGDKFDNDNSNIVHLFGCLKKDDPSQVTYYQSGIGTYDGKGVASGVAAAVDMAVGSGLGVHIRDAYHFLMQTYHEGDKICIFGFSRGAYTARCLAGMLHKVGLLPANNPAQIPFAYDFYKDNTKEGWKMSAEFKKTFCIACNVYFMGVFDCVASVGFVPRKLPFSSTPSNKTAHFRHAMALDEHRSKFKILFWQRQDKSEDKISGGNKPSRETMMSPVNASNEGDNVSQIADEDFEKQARAADGAKETDVLEVWFAGGHADVGGGAVPNEERHMLSRIPLRWMIRQCFLSDSGILFETLALAEAGLDVHTLWPVYVHLEQPKVGPSPNITEKYETGRLGPISRRSSALQQSVSEKHKSGDSKPRSTEHANYLLPADWIPEQVEDYFDAMAPINDQLVQAKGWWVLELWPIKVRFQCKNSDDWEKKVRMNLGKFRAITDSDPNLHWTVVQRQNNKGYKMRSRISRNTAWKIVS